MALHKNHKLALGGFIVVAAMIGLTFASVPLYKMFCQATGLDGTTQVAKQLPDTSAIISRTMTVRFNADTQADLPWTFVAETKPFQIKLGEAGHAMYRVTNNSRRTIIGMASYNVTPEKMGLYFEKVQCFCFEPHAVKPGETKEFPVLFFIDPAMDKDKNLDGITDVTLSYTYFEAKNLPENEPAK